MSREQHIRRTDMGGVANHRAAWPCTNSAVSESTLIGDETTLWGTPTVKNLVQKWGSLTRYFRDSSDREAGAEVIKMTAMESENDIEPSSPVNSEISNKSLESRRDADIRDLLRNLPSKADLASMLGKLEATFQNKIETIEAEVQQVSHLVTDLEEERDVIQAQITSLIHWNPKQVL
ncbi:Hypothetical predicted protein [Pelobates cultripes]|uniref:Uncharacterized protein n=1 Tax=Pelobates cultripes TaxID=61616 RepID=A0AAD1W5E2_PELCU|nr:Hypothetical predicted protein [Pelobates cultripes]